MNGTPLAFVAEGEMERYALLYSNKKGCQINFTKLGKEVWMQEAS